MGVMQAWVSHDEHCKMKGGVWHSTHRTGVWNSGAGKSNVVRGQCPTVPYWCLAGARPVRRGMRCSVGAGRGVQRPGDFSLKLQVMKL